MRSQREGLFAGDLTPLIVDAIQLFEQQGAGCVDKAILVVQLTVVHVQAQAGFAEQLAALLVKPRDRCSQRSFAADTSSVTVIHLSGVQIQRAGAVELPGLTIVKRSGGDCHRALGADRAVVTVIQMGTYELQRAIGHQ
ncbi:hypothetical protein D3C81_1130520 [compost metagenome]